MIALFWIVGTVQAQVPLAPTSKWEISSAAFPCSLARSYESGAGPVVVQIAPGDATPAYDLFIVAGRGALPRIAPGGRGVIGYDDNSPHHTFAWTQDATDDRRVLRTQLSREFVDGLASAGKVLTVTSGKYSVALSAPGLAAALSKLKTCHGDALRAVGADPALWFENRMAKLGNPGRFFSDENSPRAADGSRLSGKVTVLLDTDTAGKITRCLPVGKADDRLAEGACRIARANIAAKPATDAQGTPVAGYALLPVVWAR